MAEDRGGDGREKIYTRIEDYSTEEDGTRELRNENWKDRDTKIGKREEGEMEGSDEKRG